MEEGPFCRENGLGRQSGVREAQSYSNLELFSNSNEDSQEAEEIADVAQRIASSPGDSQTREEG